MAATESGVVTMSAVAAAAAAATTTTDDVSSGLSYKGMSSDNIKGLVLALSSSLFIGASFIVKKKGLKKTGASGVWAGVGGYSYLYEPLWWIGMITTYAFAPAILVTPLGALSIIISAVLAHIILREKLHIFGVLGCALCVVGSTTIVLHAPHEREIQSDRVGAHKGADPSMGDRVIPPEDSNIHGNSAANGEEWVELVLTEMKNATSIDDAKARAARVLQKFEKAIHSQSSSGTSQNLEKDNLMLKEKLGVVLHQNTILKRPVAIQHERHKEFDNKVQKIQHMKQMVTQYQEQVRTLEVWVVLLLWQVLFWSLKLMLL